MSCCCKHKDLARLAWKVAGLNVTVAAVVGLLKVGHLARLAWKVAALNVTGAAVVGSDGGAAGAVAGGDAAAGAAAENRKALTPSLHAIGAATPATLNVNVDFGGAAGAAAEKVNAGVAAAAGALPKVTLAAAMMSAVAGATGAPAENVKGDAATCAAGAGSGEAHESAQVKQTKAQMYASTALKP